MKLTLKQIRQTVLFLTLLILVGGFGYSLGYKQAISLHGGRLGVDLDRRLPIGKQKIKFNLFWQVWDRLAASFLDKEKVNPVQMVYGAISGMVASLDDPYTVFLPPDENQRASEDLAGVFGGIGIQLGFIDNQLVVIAPLAETPAARAGIKAGDLILKIDDLETIDISLPRAVDLIRGKKGTRIILTLLHREENLPYEAEIIRDEILVKSVELDFLDDWCSEVSECSPVAYLRLARFGDRTNEEWSTAVEEINQKCSVGGENCLGIILDLRNNPGGYLTSSVFIASEFLPSGIVVQQENADGVRENFSVNRTGRLFDSSLVVLVNKGSASASEIVAGALKEQGRGKIVGETTFGKGTIQEAEDLEGRAGLHITTARWLLPSGQSVDEKGLVPDIEVINDSENTDQDLQLEKAIEILVNSK